MTTYPARSTMAFAACLLIALALTGCMVSNPFERQSARNRWSQAFYNGQYGQPANILRGPAVPAWEAEANQLRQQHGKVRAMNIDDLSTWQNEAPFTSVRVTWADGHQRCFRFRRTNDDRLELLDTGWQDCPNVPFNPTPPPGP